MHEEQFSPLEFTILILWQLFQFYVLCNAARSAGYLIFDGRDRQQLISKVGIK